MWKQWGETWGREGLARPTEPSHIGTTDPQYAIIPLWNFPTLWYLASATQHPNSLFGCWIHLSSVARHAATGKHDPDRGETWPRDLVADLHCRSSRGTQSQTLRLVQRDTNGRRGRLEGKAESGEFPEMKGSTNTDHFHRRSNCHQQKQPDPFSNLKIKINLLLG